MNIQRNIEVFLILLFAYLNIFNSEHFKHSTSKFLNVIQSLNLDCMRVNISDLDAFVFNFILNMEIPLIISEGLSTLDSQFPAALCSNYIFQLPSTTNLESILHYYVTHKGVMFILFKENVEWSFIYTYSTYLWRKHHIYKVFYITAEHSKFYHPFVTWGGKYGALVDTRNYNIKDIFHNLNGYPVRIYIFDSVFSAVKKRRTIFNVAEVEGVDAKAAYLLEKIFNFSTQLQWPYENYFGARLENGSFNGALGSIIRYETDISMTGFFVKDYLTRDIHFSVSVYMDKLCCYVIKSKRIPRSILPLYAVNENVWIVYVSLGVFACFVWILLRSANLYIDKYAGKQKSLKKLNFSLALSLQYLSVCADTWVLWMRMIIVRFPPYNSERMFAISLCLVAIITEAIFQSSLTTVYINTRYYKDINNLEELEKANLKIFIKHAAMRDDLFRDKNSRLYNSLDERVMLVGEPEERLISIMSKRGGFAAVTREFSLLTSDIYYFVTKKIHIIPDCPKTYHIAYLFPKNSPYEESFNVALLQFLAAGLIDQWIDDSTHQAQCRIHKLYNFKAESSHQLKAFQINDIQLALYALIFGNICAALLFLAEILIYKKLSRKINFACVVNT